MSAVRKTAARALRIQETSTSGIISCSALPRWGSYRGARRGEVLGGDFGEDLEGLGLELFGMVLWRCLQHLMASDL